MHERLAAKDAEENVAVSLGVVDETIHRIQIDVLTRRFHINPAALATQVATVNDRDIEERRKVFAATDSLLELLDREHSLDAKIPRKFPEAPHVSGSQCSIDKAREHAKRSGWRVLPVLSLWP